MAARTPIEWTDTVWNPVTGCDKVSAGCRNCYAESMAHRFWGARPFTDVRCHPERLDAPLHWKKPRRVFVNSMSDLFHEDVPLDFVKEIFGVMCAASEHTFQILTKRPRRMKTIVDGVLQELHIFPPRNVWLGVSIEDQLTADERIPILLQTPAARRFVSAEPLLGPVDLTNWLFSCDGDCDRPAHSPLPTLDWVIVGGESGPQARPCQLEWIRSIVQQCRTAGIPVFVKQLGSRPSADVPELDTWPMTTMDEHGGLHFVSRKGGNPSEWPEDLRAREWPR